MFSDFQTLIDKVHKDKKGFEGRKPRLERVPVCTSILVTGLWDEITDDTIHLYFENGKRSGGSDVRKVERVWKEEAVVSFEDSSSKKTLHIVFNVRPPNRQCTMPSTFTRNSG